MGGHHHKKGHSPLGEWRCLLSGHAVCTPALPTYPSIMIQSCCDLCHSFLFAGHLAHHHAHHALPIDLPPVPEDVHVGIRFPPESIVAATSKRCRLLGQVTATLSVAPLCGKPALTYAICVCFSVAGHILL